MKVFQKLFQLIGVGSQTPAEGIKGVIKDPISSDLPPSQGKPTSREKISQQIRDLRHFGPLPKVLDRKLRLCEKVGGNLSEISGRVEATAKLLQRAANKEG